MISWKGKRMTVQLETSGEICVLRLEGRFATGQDSEYLRTKTEELKNAGCRHIIADFSKVSYIDSTGIGFLIAIYTGVLRDRGGEFVLAGPNRRVRDVLDLTKLSSILKLYEDESAARTALTEPWR
jgi:anti-sigma B factor antagonist